MNKSNEIARKRAVSNALSSIRKDRRFPEKVLVGHWGEYLFFDPFIMFGPKFIDVANLLLSGDGSVIALINLGNVIPIDYDNPPVLFIEENTQAKEYVSELENRESPSGVGEVTGMKEHVAELTSKRAPLSWRVLVDRYVCASDEGNWSIYCERENDVGVFAFREGFSQAVCLQIERLLEAKSIRCSSSAGDTWRFDFAKLLPNWRAALVAEHSLTNK